MTPAVVAGVFVGGGGTRLGGLAKGMMLAPGGETIVDRWRRLLDKRGVAVVLVGVHAAYAHLGMERIDDEPRGIGPLGGMVGLLRRAGRGHALALACDMPFVSEALLERLVAAASGAAVVAPRVAGIWEPCARSTMRRGSCRSPSPAPPEVPARSRACSTRPARRSCRSSRAKPTR